MVNVLVFVVMCLSDFGLIDSGFTVDISDRFAMIPQDILDGERLYTLFTSVFLHAGFFHLFGNVLFLYIFGDNVEGAFGHVSYIGFYVVCGLVAGFVHILSITNSGLYMVPVVGASGAISGVLGAYLVLYPKAKVLTLIFPLILPLPAIIFLGFW
ncbi:rhomboid family intramembrane serine protease, partial [Candidatus Bathyarchaeota archaeon]|nr:rhomboid family intramembrane serine protease [Candidatus Bathyarchaeota archaeon]